MAVGVTLAATVFAAAFAGRSEVIADLGTPRPGGHNGRCPGGGIAAPWAAANATKASAPAAGPGLAFIAVSVATPVAAP
jgi:hypothetical protein